METQAQKNRFFQAVANNCKYKDVEVTKDVYYAMVRTIMQESRRHGKVLLPDFGTMEMQTRKAKVIRNITTGLIDTSRSYKLIKFNMSKMLKEYINSR